jgi:hypothetical protein
MDSACAEVVEDAVLTHVGLRQKSVGASVGSQEERDRPDPRAALPPITTGTTGTA